MRSLLLFVIRYNAFFLFVLLEAISFYLIAQNGTESQISKMTSTSNQVTGFFTERYNNVIAYWNLPEENEALKKKNAKLMSELRSAKFDQSYTIDSVRTNDSLLDQRYYYLPAKVINNSVNLQNNYITLNRGLRHGIEPHSGVISRDGIVGIVLKNSKNFSTVLSLLHRDTHISAGIKRNNFHGSLVWTAKNPKYMTLEAIPKHADVVKNDTIITTGFSSIFPEGLMIGTVDTFWINPGSSSYTIDVKLNADLNKIRNVYVIQDLMKEEKVSLEEQTTDG